MSLFGITEQGFTANQIGSRPRCGPGACATRIRSTSTRARMTCSLPTSARTIGKKWTAAGQLQGRRQLRWKMNQASHCHPTTGPGEKCPLVGALPVAEYPHQEAYPGAPKETSGWGCSIQGLGVANYGGLKDTYLAGDWCSGRLFGVAWDTGAKKWVMAGVRPDAAAVHVGQPGRRRQGAGRQLLLLLYRRQGPGGQPQGRAVARAAGGRCTGRRRSRAHALTAPRRVAGLRDEAAAAGRSALLWTLPVGRRQDLPSIPFDEVCSMPLLFRRAAAPLLASLSLVMALPPAPRRLCSPTASTASRWPRR